jgi:hypothetical protein
MMTRRRKSSEDQVAITFCKAILRHRRFAVAQRMAGSA